jgi:23S rRNA pseudouridine1911/1915/1917 synthase
MTVGAQLAVQPCGVPSIVLETVSWSLIRKPHGIPSAPLRSGEEGTLLSWFLGMRSEAASVRGRKEIEHGLVHRLDTATEGLVLVAKTQCAYDFFLALQQEGKLVKTYFAYCSITDGSSVPRPQDLPLSVRSRFRAFGPGRKEVRPVFPGMRGYDDMGADYETVVESVERCGTGILAVTCSLSRGYRHQVRSHLASIGLPIIGDRLYNPAFRPLTDSPHEAEEGPLELHAVGINFTDPDSLGPVSFSLPKPDRTTR